VPNCDVKRFHEDSGAGFLLLKPRQIAGRCAAVLKQTAVPANDQNLTAQDVKIAVLGEFAIIHDRTS